MANSVTDSKDILKKKEYEAFVKALKFGSVAHWVDIARALNVDEDTITAWKKLPEAQQAIQDGIDQAFAAMQQAGGKDWKMWEAKLKMFGVNPPTKVEATIDDPRLGILNKYMGDSGAGETQETKD